MTGFTFASAVGRGDDVAAASRAAFATIESDLRRRGVDFADIVRMRFLYTDRADHPVMNEVREPLFRSVYVGGDFPSSAGFVAGDRGDGSPQFGLEAVAHVGKRTAFSPAVIRSWGGVQPPFVHVTEAGGAAFVSGQTAFEADGTFPERRPGEQARKVLGTIAPILAEVDRTTSDLLAISLFVAPEASGESFGEVREALDEFLECVPAPRPVVTCVGVRALVFDGALVGVESIAGAPGAVRRGSCSDRADTALALGSTAACSGELVVGSVSVSETRVTRAIEQAAAALADGVAAVAGSVAPGSLVTAFYGAQLARDEIERGLPAALEATLPRAIINPVPMRAARGVETLVLETYGSAEASPVNEPRARR